MNNSSCKIDQLSGKYIPEHGNIASDTNQKITELGVEAIAYYVQPDVIEARTWGSNTKPVGPDHTLMVMPKYLNTRAQTIFGGSNEVQRNIMAKAVLGL